MKVLRISVFMLLSVIVIAAVVRVYVRTYVLEDFPIFTDEETIEETKTEHFGVLAEYL